MSHADAQGLPSVLVVQGAGVSAPVKQGAVDALLGQVEVIDEMDYLIASQDAGLEPDSEQALTELAPQQGVGMLVVLQTSDAGLRVSYLHGATGQTLRAIDVAPLGARLTPEQQAQIGDGAQLALDNLAGPAEVAPEALPEPLADDLPPPSEGVDDLPLPPPDEPTPPSLAVELAAGGGMGMREIDTPSNGGPRTLSTGVFPVVDLAVRVATPPRGRFHFAFSGRYQTSVFLEGNETPSGGVPRSTTMRSHHGQLGFTPGYRFTESAQSTVIALFLGWDVRALGFVDSLSIPAYTQHGPVLRPELHISFGERLSLRAGAELIVLSSISEEMRDLAAVESTAVALGLGVEGALMFRLFDAVALALTFRESHISAATEFQVSFTDAERFLILQGVLQY